MPVSFSEQEQRVSLIVSTSTASLQVIQSPMNSRLVSSVVLQTQPSAASNTSQRVPDLPIPGGAERLFQSALGRLAVGDSISSSRIVDIDFAQETASLTKNQLLQQAGIAMLSQANSMPQAVLALLRS